MPTIAVVGDQSTGKSSLLESLSGLDLPSGVTLTTRAPLVIQMRRKLIAGDSKKITGWVLSESEEDKEVS